MSRLEVRASAFYRDGKPFFYYGDTLWMAFSKLSLAEWAEMLDVRSAERFTVAQISVLPIGHDNALDARDLQPFAVRGGRYDYDEINEAYFDRAAEMLKLCADRGIVPCLHLLWVDYVPDTWAVKGRPDAPMTWPQMEKYLRYALPRFTPYAPIYSVSGDTKFETEEMVEIYKKAIAVVRETDPDALVTMHLSPHANPPKCLELDFYSYQSGHQMEEQDNAFLFADQFLARGDGKPIVNSEPPYEGHGHGFRYGRYGAADVRRALWMSLAAGASAGLGYGAHGVWMMYRPGQEFTGMQFSSLPFAWRTALQLPGAWEGGFAAFLFDQYGLYGMKPCDCLKDMPPQVRCAKAENGNLAIYAPFPCEVRAFLDPEAYDIVAIEMEHRRVMRPEVVPGDGLTRISMPQVNSDVLYLAKKR